VCSWCATALFELWKKLEADPKESTVPYIFWHLGPHLFWNARLGKNWS